MKQLEIIKQKWQVAYDEMACSPAFQRINNGEITAEHYKSLLRQQFHCVRENPQMQAYLTAFLKGERRDMIKFFFRHLPSEIAHGDLVLNDLKILDVDVSEISYERPLPATTALISYGFYQIQHLNPVGFLGYLFHLKNMPLRAAKIYLETVKKIGVPDEATSFIQQQIKTNIVNNALMDSFVKNLIQSEDDMESVIYAARVTARLHTAMLSESLAQADNRQNWGINYLELGYSGKAVFSQGFGLSGS
ncbi:MAG: long-chain acyl-CoA synthetase [Bacteriovoracaceae bacterium]|nr:long-chain acyl-CoA synthetase [Bacteriovoracaceae bacterium]